MSDTNTNNQDLQDRLKRQDDHLMHLDRQLCQLDAEVNLMTSIARMAMQYARGQHWSKDALGKAIYVLGALNRIDAREVIKRLTREGD